ncbi:hypothetical protein BJF93_21365 [Xaviernesmea oryzae]|uniref:Uncharacterized protein n=1 Tax=Xaviernesmea oryzae TaxID=464029 RepID=A0A1Q9B030_9HYPH|nr:hypothetical protein BJF93_21365 [Xaviernesmea oryzae]
MKAPGAWQGSPSAAIRIDKPATQNDARASRRVQAKTVPDPSVCNRTRRQDLPHHTNAFNRALITLQTILCVAGARNRLTPRMTQLSLQRERFLLAPETDRSARQRE